ncbi:MAG TPA: translocation/assembly module TamB domain-containing protein [Candidatus Acidoferrales bacterium]|nr:translocation/assembly module TamB domain-containing protein [Candidatus Acidoferrales bacterium]
MSPRLRHWIKVAALTALSAVAFFLLLFQTGLPDFWMRRAVVQRLAQITGGGVELGEFRFSLWHLRVELFDLTIHGSEPPGSRPYFHANYILAGLRVVSWLGRRVVLDELRVDHPSLDVRILRDGKSNVPHPAAPSGSSRALTRELFSLEIGRFQIINGDLRWNDARSPLALDAQSFRFLMRLHPSVNSSGMAGIPVYDGELSARKIRLQAGRSIPFPSDLDARFSLSRDAFSVDDFAWRLPHSELRGRAALSSFVRPSWDFSCRLTLDFRDVRDLLRVPQMPDGRAQASAEGRWENGALSGRGDFSASDISLPYLWFHAAGFSSRGRFELLRDRMILPDFHAAGLGGSLDGRLEMLYHGLRFHLESDVRQMSLASILAALHHPGFPVDTLHWESLVAVHSVTSWDAGFHHFDSRGETEWTPPASPAPGLLPAAAHAEFHFSRDAAAADLSSGLITTPGTRVAFAGRLGSRDSNLHLELDARDLLSFDDFINALRGADAEPQRIAGRGSWVGTITGPLARATLAGHVRASRASYAEFLWDEVEGDVSYSPASLQLDSFRASRGHSSADLSLELFLSDWAFLPENPWRFDLHLARTNLDGIQSLFATAYPAHGLLTGRVRGSGTRDDPEFDASLQVDQPSLAGVDFDSARGDLHWTEQEFHARNLSLRFGPGHASGSLDYDRDTEWISFDLKGTDIALSGFPAVSAGAMPVGGRVTFQARGEGPLLAPRGTGEFHLAAFRLGEDVFGDFNVRARSDGKLLTADATSAMARGGLSGHMEISLSGALPASGQLHVQDVALDSFLKLALHLKDLTGHSSVTGSFIFSGEALNPAGLQVQTEFSRISFDYAFVKLENVGPVRITYNRDEVQVDSAHLRGPDTDLVFSGRARFARDRLLALKLAGKLNLRLLSGILPDLDARGPAALDVTLQGTTAHPRLAGRLILQSDSAVYGDFPVALSGVNGEVLFDVNRLTFENIAATVGGGQVQLSGSVSYGEGPVHYDVSGRGRSIRVRYPEGMSWLLEGNLRLQGGPRSGVLSGRMAVDRLLLTEGLDLSGLMGAKGAAAPVSAATADYLRNLQLDVEAGSSPGALVQWSSARFSSEAQLRIRGTADRPVILGHVHLLSGEFDFRGNTYRLTRGDINFSNPFRLDPIFDLEAATTVEQYDVTIQLSGPGSRLRLGYRSDPPLPSTDVISLLALGRTTEATDLRTGASTSALGDPGAQALLGEAVSSQVGGRIEKLFGVSRFRVDPGLTGVGATQNTTARITVQQRISHDLTITYVSDVTSTQRQVIQLEYNVSRKFTIRALRDENDTYGVDFILRKYFK